MFEAGSGRWIIFGDQEQLCILQGRVIKIHRLLSFAAENTKPAVPAWSKANTDILSDL